MGRAVVLKARQRGAGMHTATGKNQNGRQIRPSFRHLWANFSTHLSGNGWRASGLTGFSIDFESKFVRPISARTGTPQERESIILERLKTRLQKNRPMISITVQIP